VNYKFLIGARKAGVLLALVLMAVSSAWAQGGGGPATTDPVPVRINLADIKTPVIRNATTSGTTTVPATVPSRTALGTGVTITNGVGVGALLTFGRWGDLNAAWDSDHPYTPDTTTYTAVSATENGAQALRHIKITGTNPNADTTYTDTLFIEVSALVEEIQVDGALPSLTPAVSHIKFVTAGTALKVKWDGGIVVGASTTAAKKVETFLGLGTSVAGADALAPSDVIKIQILSGSIEASSKYLIKDVGGNEDSEANQIGADTKNGAGSKNITLKAHGYAAIEVIVGSYDGSVATTSIYPPNSGTYLIESDSAAIVGKIVSGVLTPVVIGTTDPTNQGTGILRVNGWKTAVAATLPARAAIEGEYVAILGKEISTGNNGIVVNSKSKVAIRATGDNSSTHAEGDIWVKNAKVEYVPAANLGGVVFEASQKVDLYNVIVTNGSTGDLAGKLIDAGGEVTITFGSFAAATTATGEAITTTEDITVTGAKISGKGTDATKSGYVLDGATVTVEALPAFAAGVAWSGNGSQTGGAISGKKVIVLADAAVTISAAGSGTAIRAETAASGSQDSIVLVRGLASLSASITVVNGQAIVARNNTDAVQKIILDNASIVRSGTAATNAPLIDARAIDILVLGTDTTYSKIVAGAGLAIQTTGGDNVTNGGTDVGGSVFIDGGLISGGVSGAIVAEQVYVANIDYDGTDYTQSLGDNGSKPTKIISTGGVTVTSQNEVVISNGHASLFNNGTALNSSSAFSAVVLSRKDSISVFNVDSIRGTGATALLTLEPGRGIEVYGGKIRSGTGIAINSAGPVRVDWAVYHVDLVTATSADVKHKKIDVTTGATTGAVSAIYASYASAVASQNDPTDPEAGSGVQIGDAKITAVGTGIPAINVIKGNVTVASKYAEVTSGPATGGGGSAIKVKDGSVYVTRGAVTSNATQGEYAGIWVENGEVKIGRARGDDVDNADGYDDPLEVESTYGADPGVETNIGADDEFIGPSRVTSNGALAVHLEGAGVKFVEVGYYGVLSAKGTGPTAGLIRVKSGNRVKIFPNAQLITPGSAYAIQAEEGDVEIAGGRIQSTDGQAITTYGGKVVVSGGHENGSLDRNIDGGKAGVRITGNKGILIRTIKKPGTGGLAGNVEIAGGFIFNKNGIAIKADDSVYVTGGEIITQSETAIITGTTGGLGLVELRPSDAPGYPKVWAAAQSAKSSPVAISSRKVRILGGTVEANTIKSAADLSNWYPESKAVGILVPLGPGTTPELKIRGNAKIIAHGSSTGIDCQDTSVTLDILTTNSTGARGNFRVSIDGDDLGTEQPWLPGAITIRAGHNGTAIRSVGEIKTAGTHISEENKQDEDNLNVGIYIATGNKADSKGATPIAIEMPVKDNANRQKDLTLERALVEAGSDGAYGIKATKKAFVRADSSVILVRHASTAISGMGGVYVNNSYVEVLATENNRVGTAIEGVKIRIAGGSSEDEEERKSEVHSKGTAVEDLGGESPEVQITGRIHLSGTVKTNLNIGASVMSDTGIVSLGSEKSRNLWKLSTYSLKTSDMEKGKALVIPSGVIVKIADNGSQLRTEKFDTVKVEGTVTTVGLQAGAKFVNGGRILVEKNGRVNFNKKDPDSFKNTANGIIVLKSGSLLDDSVLVHDTGILKSRAYTFLKWAKILSGDSVLAIGSRGPGKVVVPPVYATLYENQRIYVDDEDIDEETEKDFWSLTSSRTDKAYTAKKIKYPLDKRYKPYFETDDFKAKGDFLLSGQGTVKVDEDGTVLFTEAGKFDRLATMTNEAGTGTKVYTHYVDRVDLNAIIAAQTEGPIFFDGYLLNADRRVEAFIGTDTVLVRDNNLDVKYTGSTAKLLDGVKGAVVEGYTDITTDKPIYYSGLGVHTFWYRGIDDTFYPLTSSVPTKVGTYEVLASFKEGNNFVEVPAEDRTLVPIGTINVVEGDIVSVFGKKDNESYQIVVDLEAKVAKSGVKVYLPSVLKFGAKYDNENLEISGDGESAIVGTPTLVDSVITFSVNNTSEVGSYFEFRATILNTALPPNLTDGNYITVRVRFLSKEEMKETKPSYISVNYRDEKLSGLLAGTTYTINGETLVATSSETAVKSDWVGTTIKVVALPAANSFKTASDTASIVIGSRQEISDTLRAVKADSAATNNSFDGRLTGTTVAMEYKLASDTTWKPASPVVTAGLKAGTYNVRLAPTATSFPSASVNVVIYSKTISVKEVAREIPNKTPTTEAAVAPVAKSVAGLTVGPSPVASNAQAKIFWNGSKSVKGTLSVFNSNGKKVASVKVSGTKQVGVWNVNNAATGTYVVKGVLKSDGQKVKVSIPVAVVR